jgi:hypothetical protein
LPTAYILRVFFQDLLEAFYIRGDFCISGQSTFQPVQVLPNGIVRLLGQEVKYPAAGLLGVNEPGLLQDGQVLGNRRRCKLKEFGDLTHAQPPARQREDGPDPVLIRKGTCNRKNFTHRITSSAYFAI